MRTSNQWVIPGGVGLLAFLSLLSFTARAADQSACIHKPAVFDGSWPLEFDRVSGAKGEKLEMYAAHPGACDSRHQCGHTHAYIISGDEVTVGRHCGEWAYVQYMGARQVTKGWVASRRLQFQRKVGNPGPTTADGNPLMSPEPSFRLIEGRGTPVCEAYLQRLNAVGGGYCGIPENNEVPGFALLHRVPLPADAVVKMSGELGILWGSPSPSLRRTAKDYQGLPDWVGTRMKAWRYQPRIDVNNDGANDDIVVWQGYGLDYGTGECGSPFTPNYKWGFRPPQLPLIMKNDYHIDLEMTARIFGRVGDGNLRPQTAIGEPPFIPAGHFITPFEYRDLTYFSAFYDYYGDYAGRRAGEPRLANVLGVLLRRNHVTREICEYRMTGNDYPPANAAPDGVIGAK